LGVQNDQNLRFSPIILHPLDSRGLQHFATFRNGALQCLAARSNDLGRRSQFLQRTFEHRGRGIPNRLQALRVELPQYVVSA